MKIKLLPALFLLGSFTAYAQDVHTPTLTSQPFGKIDKADLTMKACDFEKDANAMELFKTGDLYYDDQLETIENIHTRIKIFNENGKSEANIRLPYITSNRYETITGLQAQTININDKGEIEITKLDKKVLYTEIVDKNVSALVFSLPNIKPGSVIEYKYTFTTRSPFYLPSWTFQSHIPVRYSEIKTSIPEILAFRIQSHIRDPLAINKRTQDNTNFGGESVGVEINTRAMENIVSMPDEPFMRSLADNLQSISFQIAAVMPRGSFVERPPDTWAKIGGALADDEDFGSQLKRKLGGEEALVAKAKALASDDAKIAYLFNEVKNTMKWNGSDEWYTNDGTSKAWDKKTGNATEINLILFHLLKQAGVKSYPMVVSTRDNGMVNPSFTYLRQFNRGVVMIEVDSTRMYVLDASNKYNSFNQVPDNLLGSTGLYIDKEANKYGTIFLQNSSPSTQLINVNGNVMADGTISGSAQISSYGYNKLKNAKRYKTDGEDKYKDYLRNMDNSLKISTLEVQNMENDSLPLVQKIDFKKELTGSDGNYIYFVPSMFVPLHSNPFLSEKRLSDIDFGYKDNFNIMGSYKLPDGYKPETLPQNVSLELPDKGIVFKRIFVQQENNLMISYVINFRKTLFFKENYDTLFEFYKKLQELINEPVALKKS